MESAFATPYPGVYSVVGLVNGSPAKILLDDAAEVNFISAQFAQVHEIAIKKARTSAEFADGSLMALRETRDPITLRLGSRKEKIADIRCAVGTLANFDLILGKQFHAHHRVRKRPETNYVSIAVGGNRVPLTATGEAPDSDEGLPADRPKVELVSKKQIARSLRKKQPIYALILRHVDEQSQKSVGLHSVTTKESTVPSKVKDALVEFDGVFPKDVPAGLPPQRPALNGEDFHIELAPDAKPAKKSIYILSEAELQEMRRQMAGLIEKGHIRPSKSPWGAPVLFTPKKDGGLRMCVDYRALNKQTIKNSYPLPRIDEIFDRLRGAKYFSKIDLRSGYHQIRLDEESIPMTAFRTRYGLFEYLVVPFGLTNAPATFMSMMNNVLHEFIDQFVMCYLDDILIFSRTLQEHIEHLRKVLEKLREHKLYAKLSKCEFAKNSVEYLGHIVTPDGTHLEGEKTRSIHDWPKPRNKKDVQSFLGLLNFYRRFFRDFARIAKPLTTLTGNTSFQWGETRAEGLRKTKATGYKSPSSTNVRSDATYCRHHRRERPGDRGRVRTRSGRHQASDCILFEGTECPRAKVCDQRT